MKNFEDWTFEEMADNACEIVLRELMVGSFRSGVRSAVDMAIRWRMAQDDKKRTKKR